MDEENQLTQGVASQPTGMVGAMQGMQFTPSSMGQYAPMEANRSSITPRELPEDWGGRPSGTSRRAIRMQADWDKKREAEIEEQRALQSMDIQQKQFEMGLRDQKMQEDSFYYDRGIQEAEQKLKAQQLEEAKDFTSAANSLDPRSPDYRDQLISLRKQYPLGALDPSVNSIIGEYDKVHSVYMEIEKEKKSEQNQERDWRVRQEDTASELGIDVDKFKNAETGEIDRVGLMREVGSQRRKQTEDKENEIKEERLDQESRGAAKTVIREINDITDELEAAEFDASNSKGLVQKEALGKVRLLQARLGRRQGELSQIVGGSSTDKPAPPAQSAPTKEEVDAARAFIRENPDSPQVDGLKAVIGRYESRESGSTTAEPSPTAPATPAANPTPPSTTPASAPTEAPFLTRKEFDAIPETRREFATGEMAETMDTLDGLRTELDRLYKSGYKFSTSKKQRDQYENVQKQIGEKRKEETRLRAARQKEISEEMNRIGPYSSGENRKKYLTLQRELRLISGV
jgi:hypothetical protein